MAKEVIVAGHAGFCFGVDRAVEMADKAIKDYPKSNIFTYGKLVHNPQVLKSLEDRGVHAVEGLDNLVNEDVLVIRAHGVPPSLEEQVKGKGLTLVDATCPGVKRVQRTVKELDDLDYQVVVFGEKGHPEVEGLMGYARNPVFVGSVEEIPYHLTGKPLGVVSQTTGSKEKYMAVVERLKRMTPSCDVRDTLCTSVLDRQKASQELAKHVELMVVIGGKKSENTKVLAEVCRKVCPTKHIAEVSEIEPSWFDGRYKIGVTTGTSTPSNVIDEVVAKIRSY